MNPSQESANSLDSLMPPIPPPPGAPEKAAPRGSKLERLARQISIPITVMIVVCGAALLWMNREEVREGGRYARKRTRNPIDLVLWMGGSDKALEDVFQELQNDERYNWDEIRTESAFQEIDFDNMPNWSEHPIVPLYNPEEQ